MSDLTRLNANKTQPNPTQLTQPIPWMNPTHDHVWVTLWRHLCLSSPAATMSFQMSSNSIRRIVAVLLHVWMDFFQRLRLTAGVQDVPRSSWGGCAHGPAQGSSPFCSPSCVGLTKCGPLMSSTLRVKPDAKLLTGDQRTAKPQFLRGAVARAHRGTSPTLNVCRGLLGPLWNPSLLVTHSWACFDILLSPARDTWSNQRNLMLFRTLFNMTSPVLLLISSLIFISPHTFLKGKATLTGTVFVILFP